LLWQLGTGIKKLEVAWEIIMSLSLAAAVLITVNIMVGSGIFINSVLLAQLAGPGSALTYLLVGLLILPLMISFTYLARLHQGGSLYSYGAQMSPYAGFFSMWGYLTTKLASCAVAIHVCSTLLSSIVPGLALLPYFVLDGIILLLFVVLNCWHVHVGKGMQSLFTIGKLIPIGTVLITGLWYVRSSLLYETLTVPLGGVFSGIPFVLYAFMGFEAATGLNRRLANPQRDGWRVIAYSFVIGVSVTTLFQWFLFGSIPQLEQLSGYRELFPALLTSWHVPDSVRTLAVIILHGGIAASAAGVAFGVLYANVGNIHELAERGLLPVVVNERVLQSSVYALLIEACIVALYLLLGSTSLPVLQQLAALGATWSYTISVGALYGGGFGCCGLLSLVSCSILLGASVYNFFWLSKLPWLLFITIQAMGGILFLSYLQHHKRQ
jgi:amino acid transporter